MMELENAEDLAAERDEEIQHIGEPSEIVMNSANSLFVFLFELALMQF